MNTNVKTLKARLNRFLKTCSHAFISYISTITPMIAMTCVEVSLSATTVCKYIIMNHDHDTETKTIP